VSNLKPLGFFLGAAFATYFFVFQSPSLSTLKTSLFGLGDDLLVFYLFEQAWANLTHPFSQPLFGATIFYPHASTLAFSEGFWLPAVFYGILRAALGPFLAFHAIVISFFALNWVAMFYFCRRFMGTIGAVAAGTIFAFSAIRLAQLSHIQLMPQFFFPLLAAAIWDYETHGNPRALYRASLCFVGQVLCSVNLGMLLAVSLVPYFFVRLIRKERAPFLKQLMLPALLTGALLAPFAYEYFSVSRTHHIVRPLAEAHIYGAHITHLLAAHPASFWGPITDGLLKAKGQLHEKRLFLGLVALFLVVIGVRRKGDRFWFWVLLSTFLFVLLMLQGPQARFYNLFYYGFPAFKGMRVPARFGFTYLFLISIVAGFGADKIKARWLLAALLFFFLFENRIPAGYVQIPNELEAVSDVLAKIDPKLPVAHFPMDRHHPVRAYYSLRHGHRIFEGYSGFIPEPQKQLFLAAPSEEVLFELNGLGVRYAILEKNVDPQWDKIFSTREPFWQNERTALFTISDVAK